MPCSSWPRRSRSAPARTRAAARPSRSHRCPRPSSRHRLRCRRRPARALPDRLIASRTRRPASAGRLAVPGVIAPWQRAQSASAIGSSVKELAFGEDDWLDPGRDVPDELDQGEALVALVAVEVERRMPRHPARWCPARGRLPGLAPAPVGQHGRSRRHSRAQRCGWHSRARRCRRRAMTIDDRLLPGRRGPRPCAAFRHGPCPFAARATR